jgi:hypothetical protein
MSDTQKTEAEMNEEAMLGEIGDTIFQSALLQFMATLDETEEEKFETFVTEHIEHENFLDEVCAVYPAFAEVLAGEVQAIEAELSQIEQVRE